MMILTVLRAVSIVCFPLLAMYLCRRFRAFEIIGPVVLCYAGGIIMAFLPLEEYFAGDLSLAWLIHTLRGTIDGSIVPSSPVYEPIRDAALVFSIPLLLYSTNFRAWLRQAVPTLVSFGLAVFSVIVSGVLAFFFLPGLLGDMPAHQITGMLVGVYTGGTPNMAAIGYALNTPEEVFVLLNTADVILGGLYFIFLISVAQRFALLFLKPFPAAMRSVRDEENSGAETDPLLTETQKKLELKDAKSILTAMLLALLVILVSAGLAVLTDMLFGDPDDATALSVPVLMLGLTTGGIVLSFVPFVHYLRGSYESGEYCIYIFCVALGSMINPASLVNMESLNVLIYTATVMLGAISLHFLLGWIFRIDADTLLITSTAAVYGPPFVGPVAEALKNRRVIVSGLTCGLAGFAIGNFLGIPLAEILAQFSGK